MILIIDNYDSFTYNLVHIIATERSDYKVIRNDQIDLNGIRALNPYKILISPGPGRPSEAGISEDLIREFGSSVPILGICLGHQAIGEVYGGDVVHAPTLMHGKTSQIIHWNVGIYEGIPQDFIATRYHSLVLDPDTLPEVLEVSCATFDGVIMGVRHKHYDVEGIQFHPESVLTVEGPRLIQNWLKKEVVHA